MNHLMDGFESPSSKARLNSDAVLSLGQGGKGQGLGGAHLCQMLCHEFSGKDPKLSEWWEPRFQSSV